MKKGLLFVVPLAITSMSIFSCSKDVTITYDDANSIVAKYQDLVKNDRARDLHVTGMVNSFNLEGDFRIKADEAIQISDVDYSIDLDLKDTKISVAKQKLAEADIPISLIRSYIPGSTESKEEEKRKSEYNAMKRKKVALKPIVFLFFPTLPFNTKELLFTDGYQMIKEPTPEQADWPFEHLTYTTVTTTYHKVGNKLRIDMKTDDLIKTVVELRKRSNKSQKMPETNINVPASVSLTISELGYIEDFSLSLKTPEKLKLVTEEGDADNFYLNINASASIDFSLHFERDYYKTVNLNYQVIEYKKDKDETTGEEKLKRVKATPISPRLKDFKDYFSAEWNSYGYYDDPIFEMNYWSDREKNVAFEYDNYDVLLVPTHDTISSTNPEWKAHYDILGTTISKSEDYPFVIPDNLCSISYNGYLVSESDPEKIGQGVGVEAPFVKREESIQYVYDEAKEPITAKNCADIYIPSKYIKDANGEYIVSIAVLDIKQSA